MASEKAVGGARRTRDLSMLISCYCHAVPSLQVKNLPDDLHEALRERARADRTTISAEVIRILRADLARSDMRRWLDEVRELPRHDQIDIEKIMGEVKDEIEGR